jgi:GntR family transcriptional regulator
MPRDVLYRADRFKLTTYKRCWGYIVLVYYYNMILRVQPSSGVPIYLQIESQVKQAIAAGALKLDDPLPPVRKLAAELRINPNTVARAYQNLERDNILRTVPGGGCYVNDQSPGLLKSEKLRRLRPMATQLAVEAKQLRLTKPELLQLLEESYNALETSEKRHERSRNRNEFVA